MNESVNYEAVCRTAPATPGLLINSLNLLHLPCHANHVFAEKRRDLDSDQIGWCQLEKFGDLDAHAKRDQAIL